MTICPRYVVCFLAPWSTLDPIATLVSEAGDGFALDEEYSILDPDPRMKRAFEIAGDRVTPLFDDEDRIAVARHRAYVLAPPLEQDRSFELPTRMLGARGDDARSSRSDGGRERERRDRSRPIAPTSLSPSPPPAT